MDSETDESVMNQTACHVRVAVTVFVPAVTHALVAIETLFDSNAFMAPDHVTVGEKPANDRYQAPPTRYLKVYVVFTGTSMDAPPTTSTNDSEVAAAERPPPFDRLDKAKLLALKAPPPPAVPVASPLQYERIHFSLSTVTGSDPHTLPATIALSVVGTLLVLTPCTVSGCGLVVPVGGVTVALAVSVMLYVIEPPKLAGLTTASIIASLSTNVVTFVMAWVLVPVPA
jgi:hypothetical protein